MGIFHYLLTNTDQTIYQSIETIISGLIDNENDPYLQV